MLDDHRLLADSLVSWASKGTTHTAGELGALGWTRWTARGLRRVCWSANIRESVLKIVVRAIQCALTREDDLGLIN